MSPGRKPSFSPASTAGRARTIRLTSFRRRKPTAIAMARKVLPVPAGPIPKTMSQSRMASRYFFCATLLGVMILLREDLNTTSRKTLSTSACLSERTIFNAATTSLDVMGIPLRRTRYRPVRTFTEISTESGSPATVSTFPFWSIVTPRNFSTIFRWSSWLPNRSARTAGSSKRTVSSLRLPVSIRLPAFPLTVELRPACEEVPRGGGQKAPVHPDPRHDRRKRPYRRPDAADRESARDVLPDATPRVQGLRVHRGDLHQPPVPEPPQRLQPLVPPETDFPEHLLPLRSKINL